LIAIYPDVWSRVPRYLYGVAFACIAITAFFIWIPWDQRVLQHVSWIAVGTIPLFPMALLVATAAQNRKGMLGTLLSMKPIVGLGRISYGLYLYHLPIIALGVGRVGWIPFADTTLGRLFIFSVMSIAVATASWIWLEKPILDLKRHFPFLPLLKASPQP